ncbi:MDR family MFS transporter [Thiomonas sp. FB-6]|uniref:MDR family MFS transporter n=1 Tax=Thiomonas sp. FB-6 TaxID=1158291 RepID=UPI000380ECDC|nr:MDR family MFS transporter [Thiomonas sp. FB-6]
MPDSSPHPPSPAPEAAVPGVRFPVLVALVVAIAFLMEQLDATIVTTALPDMARALHTNAVDMNLAISSYVLTLAVFIPLSGWFADRFGARRVFMAALALFTTGSVLCGAAQDFGMLVATRVLQGLGGAMMTPVGRLILLRSFPRSQLVRAMTYMIVPAIVGPVLGPPVGGYLSTYLSWRWIFYVNVPFGLLGMLLAWYLVSPQAEEPDARFDFTGFALFGCAIALLQFVMESLGRARPALLLAAAAGCVALLLALLRHNRTRARPAVDLGLLRQRAFGTATLAGGLCRVAMNAPVYLLPLMLQLGMGLSAVQSGSLTFLSAISAPGIRAVISPALRRWGFRGLLTGSAVACSAMLCVFSLLGPHTPKAWIAASIIAYGAVRSTQFMSSNTLAYADVQAERLSRATSLGGLLQQLTVSFGVAMAATLLRLLSPGDLQPGMGQFHTAFVLLAALPLLTLPVFLRLRAQDGATVSGQAPARDAD